MAPVVCNISLIPGPPLGPSYLIIIMSPSLYLLFLTALYADSSVSKHLAFPVNCNFFKPAIFTIAPSGAKFPFKPTTPPSLDKGLLYLRITFCFKLNLTFFKFCLIVFPVTVMQLP